MNFRQYGIRFNALCPAAVQTPFLKQLHKTYYSHLHEQKLREIQKIASVSSPWQLLLRHWGCYPLRMSAKRRTTEWQKLSKGRGCYKVGITCKCSWHVFIQWGLFNYRCPSGITSLRWIEVGYRLPLLHVTVSKLIIPSWLNLGFNIPFGCGLQAKEGGIESRNSLQTSLMDNLIVIIHRHHHHNRNHCMPIVSLINQSWSPSSGFRTPFWET